MRTDLANAPTGSPTATVPVAAAVLFAGAPVRTLRAVHVAEGRVAEPVGATSVMVVVDTETTGCDREEDAVIELALRRVRVDRAGRVVEVGRGQSWLEDPGRPLDPSVSRLTGLTDADLRGRHIDADTATGILRSADWVCAHNSGFDRRFVERRLPQTAGANWCCSCVDVDWPSRGFDGRGLGWLLAQAGLVHTGHRALADVDAVVALLATERDGRTALCEMIDNASAPAWHFTAVGANFATKDALKARGYRWSSPLRVWQREVPDRERQTEEFWLARTVYSDEANPKALAPRIEAVDPARRFL